MQHWTSVTHLISLSKEDIKKIITEMRLSIKLIFLLVTLFACLELSNAAPKSRGKGGKLKSPTNSLYINSAERHFYETKFEIGAEIYICIEHFADTEKK